jgi:hypothetical protein
MRAYPLLIGDGNPAVSFRTCSMRFAMSAQKLTSIVDTVAMTLVNAALVIALPMSAVLFVSHSI